MGFRLYRFIEIYTSWAEHYEKHILKHLTANFKHVCVYGQLILGTEMYFFKD